MAFKIYFDEQLVFIPQGGTADYSAEAWPEFASLSGDDFLAAIAASHAAVACLLLKEAQQVADMGGDLAFEAQFQNVWCRWVDWLQASSREDGRLLSREEIYCLLVYMAKRIRVAPLDRYEESEPVDIGYIRPLSGAEMQAANEQLERYHAGVDWAQAA